MTRIALFACPACERHVRVDEARCPFCATELSDEFRARVRSRVPVVRLSRAALYAFGLGTVTVTGACGGQVSKGPQDGGGGLDSGLDAALPHDAGALTDTTQPLDTGNITVPYGLPAMDAFAGEPDTSVGIDDSSSPIIDSSAPLDATHDVGPAPPYGLPPPPQDE